jgi:tRNA 5-methylaminomethyl-2-thiouridine biosynthesis bifunctional protein
MSEEMATHGAHLEDLPRRPGLYASFAFGSRGLSLAPLAGELIAAQVEGEPWPLERSLAARVDVARFLLQRMRGVVRSPQRSE